MLRITPRAEAGSECQLVRRRSFRRDLGALHPCGTCSGGSQQPRRLTATVDWTREDEDSEACVFVPEATISLRRPRAGFADVFNLVMTVALPFIAGVYVGIAERAVEMATPIAARRA